jgi:hypothetical protein
VKGPEFQADRFFGGVGEPNSQFTSVSSRAAFWVYDWQSNSAEYYGDDIFQHQWNPILQGFLIERSHPSPHLEIIKP